MLAVLDGQDSGRTLPLSMANALVLRDIDAPAKVAGDMAEYIDIA
jgi:hypothetical protein